MNGKIILNLAMSVDGYIASEDGGYDWIQGDGNTALDTVEKWDYFKFLEDIDIVVMGKKCFDQGFHKDFIGKEVYIASSEKREDFDNIHFINGNIGAEIEKLRACGKNVFLFGGGIMIDHFIKENLIDEYVIGIIPTILGKGIKLFLENNPRIDLSLQYYSVDSGVVMMRYTKRS